ncbi:MAG: wbmP [Myxococcaceae bacterium]|nr:wbmP [Myxococcaceae bacterium]
MPDTSLGAGARPPLHIVACHQPNFFPWLGYFHKVRWAETFVVLDDALIQKTGGTVTNRTSLAPGGKQIWFTAPIDRSFSGTLPIDRARFSEREPFRERLLTTLRTTYSRSAHFSEVWSIVAPLVEDPEPLLATYNTRAITRIAEVLALPAKLMLSSSLGIEATSTERLVEIVNAVSGDTYLYGGGAKDYQDDAQFFRRGIHLYEQGFRPPTYARGTQPEIAGLSILDALFFLGREGTRKLLDAPLPENGLRLAGGPA